MLNSDHRILYENPKMWGKVRPETDLERAAITSRAVPKDVKTILEVGAGDGLVLEALRNSSHEPVASDISRNALKCLKGNK